MASRSSRRLVVVMADDGVLERLATRVREPGTWTIVVGCTDIALLPSDLSGGSDCSAVAGEPLIFGACRNTAT